MLTLEPEKNLLYFASYSFTIHNSYSAATKTHIPLTNAQLDYNRKKTLADLHILIFFVSL